MKILITGICGFVGSTLAKAWLDFTPGLEISGLDNLIRPGSEENRRVLQRMGIKVFHCDIRSASDFETLPRVDWVLDAAANPSVLAGIDGQTSSRQLIEHNLVGTLNILEYCKRHGIGFIQLSSSRVYSIKELSCVPVRAEGAAFKLCPGQSLPIGISEDGVSETFSTAAPISLYGSTKLTSEILAMEYGKAFGFPVWINRCGVMAGAGQFGRVDQGVLAYWLNSWVHRSPLTYIGFGGLGYQVRDFLHPQDLMPLLLKQTASDSVLDEQIFNIGGGLPNALSLAELSSWCCERFGAQDVGTELQDRCNDVPWLVMDSSRAYRTWGWKPQRSIDTILEEIADHAEQHPEWLKLSGIV